MSKLTALHVAPTDTGCLIRIQGRGMKTESPAAKAVVMQALLGDERTVVVIDLSECDYLDSTFLGSLLQLYNQFGRSRPPRFVVAASAEKRKALLHPAHIDLVIPSIETAPATRGDWVSFPLEPVGPRELSQHMMECHRALSKFDSPMSATFARIADHLERELAKPKW